MNGISSSFPMIRVYEGNRIGAKCQFVILASKTPDTVPWE